MSGKLIVLGPNGINDATFHVHRVGCADLNRPKNRAALADRSNWIIEDDSEQAIVENLFSDFIEDDEWQDYAYEVRIFPCCGIKS